MTTSLEKTIESSDPSRQLDATERDRLSELEPLIERGMTSFVEVGNALLEISDRRLYRETHSTFAEYCETKWRMSARRAYQLCEAAEVVNALPENVKHVSHLNPRQACELAKVEPARRTEVLQAAASQGALTAATIRAAAESEPAETDNEARRNIRRSRIIAGTMAAVGERAIIIQADCLRIIDALPPIDLLIADPPYFTDGDFTAHISAFLAKVKRTGQAYVFASASPEELAAYLAMDRHGMDLAQVLVWNYNNACLRLPNERYRSNYQVAFYFRGENAPQINNPVDPNDGNHQAACQTVNAPDGRLGDRFFKWQKPIELIERYICNSSQPGEFVFDPFAGSGSTMLAAAKLGRKTLGCEIDPATIAIAVERGCQVEPSAHFTQEATP